MEETNKDLENSAIWFQVNRLILKVLKTKYIIFRNKNMPIKPDEC